MKNKKKPRVPFKEILANALDMSKEIIMNAPRVVFIGDREMSVENYKGIVECTEKNIRVKTENHILKISGRKLEIKIITQEMLQISGYIECFEFLK